MPPQPDVPPYVPWSTWYPREAMVPPGHKLFSGPTQSGKTLLCRLIAGLRQFVVVFGTKPVDPSLDQYLAEGYVRIDHWPPTRQDLRRQRYEGEAKFILWPKIEKREDLRRYAHVYAKAMDMIFIEGNWTIVVDEGLWIADGKGLGLGDELGQIAYGSASNGVKLYVLVQRLSNVGPLVWTQASQALVFHSGRVDDVRELATLGTYEPRDTQVAIRQLRGHQFLDLPCRGGAEWAVSEVRL